MIELIAQALILQNHQVLMVRQYVERGDIVWNFPGGGVEQGETPEQACIREVKEETGYEATIVGLLDQAKGKYTFIAEICGGAMHLDKDNGDNDDILDVAWVSLKDSDKFDAFTGPMLELILSRKVE